MFVGWFAQLVDMLKQVHSYARSLVGQHLTDTNAIECIFEEMDSLGLVADVDSAYDKAFLIWQSAKDAASLNLNTK